MTMGTTSEPSNMPFARYSAPRWRRLIVSHESALAALILIVLVSALISVRNFGSPITANYFLLDIAPVLMIALAMTLVIVAGEIDLSVASVFGLSSVVLGVLFQAGVPIAGAIVAAIGAGALAGLFNGYLVAYVGLPSLAVTIGTLALYRGIAVGSLGTTAVTGFPSEWTQLAKSTIGSSPIPLIMVPVVVLIVVFVVLLHFTPFGRGVYAIGQSSVAATFSAVDVRRTKLLLFVASGAVAALAGTFVTLRFSNAIGSNGIGIELQVIAAVVLGGVSIFGGRGTVLGAVLGVVLIGVLASALRLASIPANTIDVITGAVLVISVLFGTFQAWLSRSRGQRQVK